jgi:hypothetical protein
LPHDHTDDDRQACDDDGKDEAGTPGSEAPVAAATSGRRRAGRFGDRDNPAPA